MAEGVMALWVFNTYDEGMIFSVIIHKKERKGQTIIVLSHSETKLELILSCYFLYMTATNIERQPPGRMRTILKFFNG